MKIIEVTQTGDLGGESELQYLLNPEMISNCTRESDKVTKVFMTNGTKIIVKMAIDSFTAVWRESLK